MKCWLVSYSLCQLILLFSCVARTKSSYLNSEKLFSDKIASNQITQDNIAQNSSALNYILLQNIFGGGERIFIQLANELKSHVNKTSHEQVELDVSSQCILDILKIRKGFKERKEWAIRLADSSAKIPSGVIDGNYLWLGNYDECVGDGLTIENNQPKTEAVKGQYCYTEIYSDILKQFQFYTKEIIIDPRIVLGLCVPASCSESDVHHLLENYIQSHGTENITSVLRLNETSCSPSEIPFDTGSITFLVFMGLYVTLLMVATIYDIAIQYSPVQDHKALKQNGFIKSQSDSENIPLSQPKDQTVLQNGHLSTKSRGLAARILLCFSLYSNIKKIVDVSQPKDSLSAIHGIRLLSISWVILGHTNIYGVATFDNTLYSTFKLSERFSQQAIYVATLSVDSFFAMSGCLLGYFAIKELKKKGKMAWGPFYFHRYWRLTPTYYFIIVFNIAITKYLSNGPVWPKDGFEGTGCERTWWKNILYINNFVSTDDVCVGWAWYLANDMQFYIISPIFLLAFAYSEIMGVLSIVFSILASWVTTGVIAYVYELQPAMSVPFRLGKEGFSYIYIKPYCRIGPYLFGLLTGYIMYKTNCTFKISKIMNSICWAVATLMAMTSLYCLYWNTRSFDFLTYLQSAFYYATFRSVWGVSVCWLIFACATGNAGIINTFLSWSPFAFLSRLSYCAYLAHPIIMYTYNYSIRKPTHYSDIEMIYLYFAGFILSLMSAFVLSVCVESPMLNLEKHIFHKRLKKR